MSLARAAVFSLALVFLPGAAPAAPVSIQLDDPVVFITPVPKAANDTTPQKGTGELVVRVEGSDQQPRAKFDQPLGTAQIKPDPPSWREEAGGSGPRIWHFLLEVTDLPANALQKNTVNVTVGNFTSEKLPFWVTNRAVKGPQFSDPVKPWIVGGLLPGSAEPRCTSILVSPGDIPATGLKLLQSTLVRESPRGMISLQDLWLCQQPDCQGPEPVWVPASRPETVWVCLAEDFWGHGKFSGNVALGASRSAEAKTVPLEIQKSDLLTRIAGFIVILFGVRLGWWLKALAKSRLNRYQALAPALALRDRFATLLERLDKVPNPFKADVQQLWTAIHDLQSELDEKNLDLKGYLPSATILPWKPTAIDTTALYKAFLEEMSAKYSTMEALVTEGVEEVLKRLGTRPPEAITEALKSLSAIANHKPLPQREAVRQEIPSILRKLDGEAAKVEEAVVPEKPLTYKQVQFQIEKLSQTVWLAWGLLTALTGLATLILTNPGFGTPLDFIFALLWGVGIPSVLNQLTPSSVTTQLGVSIPA